MSAVPTDVRQTPADLGDSEPEPGPNHVDGHDLVAATVAGAMAGGLVAVITTRRVAPVRSISMGPGGWVSFRGTAVPGRIRTYDARRPWWAHLLGAHELRPRRGLRRNHG